MLFVFTSAVLATKQWLGGKLAPIHWIGKLKKHIADVFASCPQSVNLHDEPVILGLAEQKQYSLSSFFQGTPVRNIAAYT